MASPSHKMSEENLEKKMLNVTNTQDSIQSLSLWLIHHKSHHKRVAEVWLKTVKKGKQWNWKWYVFCATFRRLETHAVRFKDLGKCSLSACIYSIKWLKLRAMYIKVLTVSWLFETARYFMYMLQISWKYLSFSRPFQ